MTVKLSDIPTKTLVDEVRSRSGISVLELKDPDVADAKCNLSIEGHFIVLFCPISE